MKDYAKIAKDVRMQEKLAEKQTIQAFVQEALPEICSQVLQDAERTAQAGEIYFPLNLYKSTEGLDEQYRDKAFDSLYKAAQKEFSRYGLYLFGRYVYFRRRTYFIPWLCTISLYLIAFSWFAYIMITGYDPFDWSLVGCLFLFVLCLIAHFRLMERE